MFADYTYSKSINIGMLIRKRENRLMNHRIINVLCIYISTCWTFGTWICLLVGYISTCWSFRTRMSFFVRDLNDNFATFIQTLLQAHR